MKFTILSNRADMKAVRATDKWCDRCGAISSAYLVIHGERAGYEKIICKGCLLDGVGMIDEELLEQAKTRVS